MIRRRYRSRLGQQQVPADVQILTEGPEAQTVTILQDHPNWGNTTNCFTTQGVAVNDGNQVFNQFDTSRVLTQADVNLLTRTKNEAEAAINDYDRKTAKARDKFLALAQEYAKIAEECGAGTRDYDTSGTGIVIALHPTGLTGATADCIITETGTLEGTKRVEAAMALDESSNARRRAFRLCDFLMVNAMSRSDAQRICNAKREAFQRNREVINEIAEANRKMDDIRNRAREQLDRSLGDLQQFFERFLALMGTLINAIKALLQAVQQMLLIGAALSAKVAGFFLRNPSFLLIVGGIVGLGVLAFVLRPYITVLSAVFGRGG